MAAHVATWHLIAPALVTAIGAELVFLRRTIAALLAGTVLTQLPPATETVTTTTTKPPTIPPAVTGMMAIAVLCAMPFFLCGCPAAGPVVKPTATLAACITADALAGKSLADIVKDCGSDVPSVVVALVNATGPGVLASKAHVEAMQVRAALYTDAGIAIGPGK